MDEVNLMLVAETRWRKPVHQTYMAPPVNDLEIGGVTCAPNLDALRATILIKLRGRVCTDGRGEPNVSR